MWGVPADHECFSAINDAQWAWYLYNFMEDNEQEVEINRDLAEYQAWFSNPELVVKIQEERESKANSVMQKDLPGGMKVGVRSSGDVRDLGNILDRVDAIEQDQRTREREVIPYNYTNWTNFDLE